MAVGAGLAALGFLCWLYDPDDIPTGVVVRQHLKGMRALVRVLRIHNDALARMLRDAQRYQ